MQARRKRPVIFCVDLPLVVTIPRRITMALHKMQWLVYFRACGPHRTHMAVTRRFGRLSWPHSFTLLSLLFLPSGSFKGSYIPNLDSRYFRICFVLWWVAVVKPEGGFFRFLEANTTFTRFIGSCLPATQEDSLPTSRISVEIRASFMVTALMVVV